MNSIAQSRIQKILDEAVARGAERGMQCTAYVNGKLVVDAWAGVADRETGRLVDGETLFPIFSVTKGIVATVIHLLAERKQLSYDDAICKYWPEFSANGKENIKIRHVLNHTAGLQNVPLDLNPKNVCDWDNVCKSIAASKATWAPGSQAEYHAVTYGWILGEIAQRVDGRKLSKIIQDEIKTPLKIEGMYIGIPDEVEYRVAILEEPEAAPQIQDFSKPLPVPNWICPLHIWMNRPEIRRACVPGSNGIMTARAIAKHYAAILPGGVDGVEILPPSRMAIATNPKIGTYNKNSTPNPTLWSLGYALNNGVSAMEEKKISPFGHGGYGGAMGFADPKHNLAVGITKNLFSKENIGPQVIQELRNSLRLEN